MQLLTSLKAEIKKYKSTWALYLAAGAPLFITAIMFCVFYFRGEKIISPDTEPWQLWIGYNVNSGLSVLLPLFLILITVLINTIEHSNNMWKHLLALPIKKTTLFITKFSFSLLLVLGSLLWYGLLILLFGNALSWLRPELNFSLFTHNFNVLNIVIQGFAAALGILSIQFFLSWRWKSVIIPLGIGMGAYIFGMVLLRWEHIVYFPYTYPLFAAIKSTGKEGFQIAPQVTYGLITASAVFVFGLWDTSKKNTAD